MRTHSRSGAAWAAGALLIGTLTACSGTDVESDPEGALAEAVDALGEYDGIELSLGIAGDRDAIAATTEGDLDASQVDLLLDSSVTIRAIGDDADDAQAEVLVELGEERAVEVRLLPEQLLFFRVDLDVVDGALDDPAFRTSVDEAVAAAEGFGLGEVAETVRSGGWIQLTGLEQLTEFAGSATDGQEPTDEETEDVRERIVATIEDFIDEDVDVAYVGTEDAGERVTATTTQTALNGLVEEISAIAGEASGVDGDQLGLDVPGSESDEPVELDLWIDDGRLSQIGFDLSRLEGEESAPEGTFLLLGLEEFSGSVGPPSDSTELDLFAILGGLFAGNVGGFDGAPEGDAGAGPGSEPGGGTDVESDDPLGSQDCIPQEVVDEALASEGGESLQSAIDEGIITVC
ncbi:MAG: hypothetical protein WEB09_10185 [Nitriliruptor sp.]